MPDIADFEREAAEKLPLFAGEDEDLAGREPCFEAAIRANDKPNSAASLWIETESGRYIFDCEADQIAALAESCARFLSRDGGAR